MMSVVLATYDGRSLDVKFYSLCYILALTTSLCCWSPWSNGPKVLCSCSNSLCLPGIAPWEITYIFCTHICGVGMCFSPILAA